ncbi:sporulation protein YunB [Ectobacillus polymachus]|uniref:sporulation protein YunB n=1 Tax=Ectobacillus polymachus TaxID=1508806 RepID=UPI003A83FBF2
MRVFRTSRFRRGPLPFRYVLLISFLIFLLLTVQGLWIISRSITPTLMLYAQSQTKRLATVIITKAVQDRVQSGFSVDKLIAVERDNQGKITTIDFNPEVVNGISSSTTASIEQYLRLAEKGDMAKLGLDDNTQLTLKQKEGNGAVFAIPLGQITNNALIGNLGPKIPVSFTTIGDVHTNIKRDVKPYGINNVMVDIALEVNVTMQVIIPFQSKETIVTTDVPIAMRVIQGEVPTYYSGSKDGGTPALPVPNPKQP